MARRSNVDRLVFLNDYGEGGEPCVGKVCLSRVPSPNEVLPDAGKNKALLLKFKRQPIPSPHPWCLPTLGFNCRMQVDKGCQSEMRTALGLAGGE